MTLVDAKYDNFTRLIYDAVNPVWKLLFEKKKKFWYILASSGIKQSKLQRAGPNRSWITDLKKKRHKNILTFQNAASAPWVMWQEPTNQLNPFP